MLHAVREVARREAGRIAGDVARRAVYGVIALVFISIALVFCALALFFWLLTVTSPPLAGLGVAVVALLIAVIALLLATRRRRPAPAAPLAAPPQGVAAAPPAGDMSRVAAEAELLGRRFGQEARGYPLVLGAFVLGLILSRGKR